jgi:Mg2+/Co2+ transporter CorC
MFASLPEFKHASQHATAKAATAWIRDAAISGLFDGDTIDQVGTQCTIMDLRSRPPLILRSASISLARAICSCSVATTLSIAASSSCQVLSLRLHTLAACSSSKSQ